MSTNTIRTSSQSAPTRTVFIGAGTNRDRRGSASHVIGAFSSVPRLLLIIYRYRFLPLSVSISVGLGSEVMASRALLIATAGQCSAVAGRRRQARCSSSVHRGPLIWRSVKGPSFVRCRAVGCRTAVENAEDVVALANGEGKKWRVHFVGIGGSGLSALAMLALKQGYKVSGSDIMWSCYMDDLDKAGAKLYLGHSIACMESNTCGRQPDAIVISSAIPKDNEEVLYAESMGIPIYKRDSWLRNITKEYNLIAIAGTHGKSTTAAMLSYVLDAMGDDLIAVVGANVPQFSGGNIIPGKGPNFVLEADEYDCCFLGLSPSVAVVTNVEWDHVDIFDNEEHVRCIFRKFVQKIKSVGHLILCGDRCLFSVGRLQVRISIKQ